MIGGMSVDNLSPASTLESVCECVRGDWEFGATLEKFLATSKGMSKPLFVTYTLQYGEFSF